MTETLRTTIERFSVSKDIAELPSIFMMLHNEEDIDTLCGGRGCFRLLRNFAAHNTDEMIKQLRLCANKGDTRVILNDCERELDFNLNQMLYELLKVALIKNDSNYYELAKNIVRVFFKDVVDMYNSEDTGFRVGQCSEGEDESFYLKTYLQWQDYMYKYFRRLKPVNYNVDFIRKFYVEKNKAFWNVAVGNLSEFIVFFLGGKVFGCIRDICKVVVGIYEARSV